MSTVPEFNPNFKIPVKPPATVESMTSLTSVVDMGQWGPTYDPNMGAQTPMMHMWGPGYPIMGMTAPSTPTVISAPPALNINGIKRKIDKDMMQELNDPSLPKELTSQFQPLYCKLCTMRLNSSSNAKLHYLSKNHQKKVRKFLIEYAEKTGEPLHKKAKVEIKSTLPDDPKYTYCNICDLQLTSKLHAEQHYMGKNHQKAANRVRPPAGSGYYDELGVWHRQEKAKYDLTGRHTIGLAFVTPEEYQKAATSVGSNSKFYCDLCKISTTSAEHLQMHINGQKHKKLLNKTGGIFTVKQEDPFEDLECAHAESIPKDNILTSVIKNDNESTLDYSVFRTPSGFYYCQPCNLTVNSEQQFVKHLESKKHFKKKTQK